MGKLSGCILQVLLLVAAVRIVPAYAADTTESASTTAVPATSVSSPSSSPASSPASTSGPEAEADAKGIATEDEAREAFHRGDRLYLEGDYEGAVAAFEEAYAKSGRIEMLFNLANAHERLGHFSEAALSLRGYIPHSPESHRPALERRLARLEGLAKEQREKERNRESAPEGALAGAPSTPFPVARGIGIGLLTLGSASLIAGTAFAISASSTRRQLNDICEDGASGRLCLPNAEALLMRDKTYSLVADITLIGGAALTATGVYLIVRSKDRKTEVQAGLGTPAVWMRGTF